MKSSAIFSFSYFGSIAEWIKWIDYQNISFSSQENYRKQSYHNRARIYGANGIQNLIIPTQHNGERKLSKTIISYAEDWRTNHLRSLQSSYRRSSYFEYYENEIEDFYNNNEIYLVDFLKASITLVQKLLDQTLPILELRGSDAEDYCDAFSPKSLNNDFLQQEYYQVFKQKHGFKRDLCILDLIFNLGPESYIYLIKQTISTKISEQ